jgi:predicted Zn-dependent protease
MSATRLEKIEVMLVEDPHDTFLRYSRGMELAKLERFDESLQQLCSLTADDPPYVPAYFMAAQQLAKLGRVPEAREQLVAGIEVAHHTGDTHAAGEMAEFLSSLH